MGSSGTFCSPQWRERLSWETLQALLYPVMSQPDLWHYYKPECNSAAGDQSSPNGTADPGQSIQTCWCVVTSYENSCTVTDSDEVSKSLAVDEVPWHRGTPLILIQEPYKGSCCPTGHTAFKIPDYHSLGVTSGEISITGICPEEDLIPWVSSLPPCLLKLSGHMLSAFTA